MISNELTLTQDFSREMSHLTQWKFSGMDLSLESQCDWAPSWLRYLGQSSARRTTTWGALYNFCQTHFRWMSEFQDRWGGRGGRGPGEAGGRGKRHRQGTRRSSRGQLPQTRSLQDIKGIGLLSNYMISEQLQNRITIKIFQDTLRLFKDGKGRYKGKK